MSPEFTKEANFATIIGLIIAGFSLAAIFLQLRYQQLNQRKEKTLEYVRRFKDSNFSIKYINVFSFIYQKDKEIKQNQFYSNFLILKTKKQLENPINFQLASNIILIVQYFNNLGSLYFHNLIDKQLLTEIFGEAIVYNHGIFKWLFKHSNRLEITKAVYGDIEGVRSLYQSSYWDLMVEDIKSRLDIMNRIKAHPLSHLECIMNDKKIK